MSYLSIYINFPFCRQKCHFCDWVQRVPKSDLFLQSEDTLRKKYIDSLCKEITIVGTDLANRGYLPKIIYFGGGTATTMTKNELDRIIYTLNSVFDLSEVSEWTIEGSPDTVTYESLKYYRDLGFNRFSVGIQSFNDQRLKHLGRRHDRSSSLTVIETAQKSGFKKLSIDLMCGFPDETLEEIEKNIDELKKLNISQLSFYTFRPTKGTILRRNIDKYSQKIEPNKQVIAYQHGSQLLKSMGYTEYGVGYFGDVAENVVGMFSLLYDVVGFGSGAISMIDGNYRSHTSGLLRSYVENPITYDLDVPILSSVGVLFSMLRSGLSIYDGIKLSDWESRFKQSFHSSLDNLQIKKMVDFFQKVGRLQITDEKIYLPKNTASLVLIGIVNASMMVN